MGIFFIGFLCGCVSTLVVLRFFLHHYMVSMKTYLQEKEQHRINFQQLISQVHHKGQVPLSKRIRGLSNLGIMTVTRVLNLLDLANRPNHQGYLKLAQKETEEVLMYWRLTQQVSEELEKTIIDNVKNFEHYQ